jgi:hypothetical protein
MKLKIMAIFTIGTILLTFAYTHSSSPDYLWMVQSFDFPKDSLSCNGKQLVQFNARYKSYVGLTLCNDRDEFRVYMAESNDGPYLPITDTAGHGQDHCELVNKNFILPNTDDIKSGNCSTCSTSENLPLENIDTWSRSELGSLFILVRSGTWANQTSRLQCGTVFENCGSIMRWPPKLNTACDANVIDGNK